MNKVLKKTGRGEQFINELCSHFSTKHCRSALHGTARNLNVSEFEKKNFFTGSSQLRGHILAPGIKADPSWTL
jgi:hypothetical protein